MAFATDTQLGPYKIISLIGAGGMGEVYRAHDTRLRRDVALKVLQQSLTADSDRLPETSPANKYPLAVQCGGIAPRLSVWPLF